MDYEALLAHSDFVRGLARSLLADRNAANDVVQQTWVAAMTHKGKEIRSLPAWLAAVVRNFARLRMRSDERRRRREQAVARPEGLPSTEEIIEREAVRGHVVEAVLDLKEPYRTVIVFRYYEDLPTGEIARRLDLPASTVRTRISRGLEILRGRLDRLYGRDRRAWQAALAPLAGLKIALPAAALPAGASTLLPGALAMSLKLKIGIITTVLIGSAFLFTFLSGDSEVVPPDQPASDQAAAAGGRSPLRPEEEDLLAVASAGERERIPPVSDSKPVLVSGRVVYEESGLPVAHVLVEPHFFPDSGFEGNKLEAFTDEEGCFRFGLDRTCRLHSVAIHHGPRSAARTVWPGRRLGAGRENTFTFEVSRGGTVEGRVIDLDGYPVANATVKGWCGTSNTLRRVNDTPGFEPHRVAITGTEGCFVIDGLGDEFVLTAEAAGMVCRWRLHGKIQGGQIARDMELVLGPSRAVRGRVLAPDRTPLAGVIVTAGSGYFRSTKYQTASPGILKADPAFLCARTDGEGTFLLAPLSADCSYGITVRHKPYLRWSRSHKPGDPALEIVLSAGVVLTGRVFGPDGRPVADARISMSNPGNPPRTRTDEKGAFTVTGLEKAADSRIAVVAPGCAVRLVEEVVISDERPNDVEVVLEPGLYLSGTVRDGQGNPVSDVAVTVRGDRLLFTGSIPAPTWEGWCGKDETRTDGEGRFRFDSLYDGAFTLSAASKDDPDLTVETTMRAGTEGIEIVLDPAALRKVTLYGTVKDELTRKPVERFEVTPMRLDPHVGCLSGDTHIFDSPDGSFEIAGLAPGEIHLSVSAPGYATCRPAARHFALGQHRVDFALVPARTLTVRVVDSRARPVEGARLSFFTEEGRPIAPPSGIIGWGTTDSRGESKVHGLPAARVLARVRVPSHPEVFEFPLDLWNEANDQVELPVEIKTLANLSIGVFGAMQGMEPALLTEKDRDAAGRAKALFQAGDCWLIDAAVTLSIVDAAGAEIVRGTCSPHEGEYDVHFVRGGFDGRTTRPVMHLQLVPGRVEIRVEAPGYASSTFERAIPEGGLDAMIILPRQ